MTMKEKSKSIRLGLLGIGTVGGGTCDILQKEHDAILQRTGFDFRIAKVLARHPEKAKRHGIGDDRLVQCFEEIEEDPSIDIVVEAMGGLEPATEYMIRAMKKGKSVVTPNKAAVASNWERLHKVARENGVSFRFEASVGGGIPILTSIQDQLAANRFTEVKGILNGTTNYILTRMSQAGLDYETALKEAQDKGFAEQDPTADVDGIDAANKLSILIALCFDRYVAPAEIPRLGIRDIRKQDIQNAQAQGKKLKLLAYAGTKEGAFSAFVKPVAVDASDPLYGVEGEYNAVTLTGNAVGDVMFRGRGAGALPTGSAVAGDIILCARDLARS